MNYDFRLIRTGIKRIYYHGNPLFNSLIASFFLTIGTAFLYVKFLLPNIEFLKGKKELFISIMIIIFIVLFILYYRKKKYIQWDERSIRFKNINGYSAIVGVDKVKSIKIIRGKGIYVTHENFYDEKMNGTYLIPFERLGRNYNTDVNIITEDFKKLYPTLILEDE